MELGEKILNLRKINGVSQEKLAELSGVSRQTVSKWETNVVQPSAANIKVLSEIFSVSTDYFFTDAPLPAKTENIADIKRNQKTEKALKKKTSLRRKRALKTQKAIAEESVIEAAPETAAAKENTFSEIKSGGALKYIIAIPVLAVIFAVSVFVTVWLGCGAYSAGAFIAMLVLSCMVFAADATLSVTLILKIKYENRSEEVVNLI